MVRLKEIEKKGNTAICRFYPEDSEESGMIQVDLGTEEIIDISYPQCGCSEAYPFYAKRRLIQLAKDHNPMPAEALAMWY